MAQGFMVKGFMAKPVVSREVVGPFQATKVPEQQDVGLDLGNRLLIARRLHQLNAPWAGNRQDPEGRAQNPKKVVHKWAPLFAQAVSNTA